MTAQFFSPEGVAKLLVVPISTVWKWIRLGHFKDVCKAGKHYRIPVESVEEFIKGHKK